MKSKLKSSITKLIALSLGLAVAGMTQSTQAANKAWSTNTPGPANGNFSGTNWTVGTTGVATPTSAAASGDALFFDTSAITTLTNDLSGASFAGLTFNSGASAFTIGGNSFTLTGNITNNGANTQTINNAMTITAATRTVTATSGQLVLGGSITGSGSLALNPTNKITLAGANNFATNTAFANLTINGGAGGVDITGSTTVGNAANVNQGGYLSVGGAVTVTIQSGGSLTINGATNTAPSSAIGQTSIGTTSTLLVNGGTLTYGANNGFLIGNGNTGTGVLTIASGTATINRGTTGAANTTDTRLIEMGRDPSAANGNTGIVNLNGGTLATDRQFVRDGSSASNSGIANFVFGGGTLKALGNQTDWLQSTTATSAGQGGGTVNASALALSSVTTTGTSTIDANGFSVAINSAISGAGGFNINSSTGTGVVTLGGSNSYTGGTTVTSGTLIVSGSISATSSTFVAGGANLQVDGLVNTGAAISLSGKLKGHGQTGDVSAAGGSTFAPGTDTTTAILTTNALTLGDGGTAAHLSIKIGGSTAGTGYDQVSISGSSTLTLNGVNLDGSLINGYNTYSVATFDTGLQQLNLNGSKFYLVIGAGNALSGVHFANAVIGGDGVYSGNYDTINFGGQEFAISYNASASGNTFTGGNDIALMAVPEPSTYAMLLGGIGMLGLWQRSRRRIKA